MNEASAAQGFAHQAGPSGPSRLAVLMDFYVTYSVDAPNSSAYFKVRLLEMQTMDLCAIR